MAGITGSPRIAIIGAGGWVFPLVLIRDILSFPGLQGSAFALHDIDDGRVGRTLSDVERLVELHNLPASAFATTDQREALRGVDIVICAFQVGGLDAYRLDVEIPRAYGVDQTVGDTLGPGGIFRGLRTVEVLRRLCADMQELCPDALLIQYANPMTINCWASERMGIETLGLCHSVQHTSHMLADELEVAYDEIVYDCAGVNHTAWFTTFRRGEEDLIPAIRKKMSDRHLGEHAPGGRTGDLYNGRYERVRAELMRLTGYFHTESSHHASEYWPWFRKDPETTLRYLPERWDYYELCAARSLDERNDEIVSETTDAGLQPSEEYGARVVNGLVSGEAQIVYGNVPNCGLIDNLPADACVEVACLVDGNGVRPLKYGRLPSACAALNNQQIAVQRLAVEAAIEADVGLLHAAVALDPLTSATLTLPEIRDMVDRMLAAEADWLPSWSQASQPATTGFVSRPIPSTSTVTSSPG